MISIDINKKLDSPGGEMNLSLKLEIKKGQFVAIYGDSGVGKTSTLRMLSGLMEPDNGRITVNGKTWFDSGKKINVSPQSRNIGYVFQDFALFPNMTVRENLEFVLSKNQNSVDSIIEIMELGELQNRKPETLSGGQKQKVALARALVQKPEILLLDEPLASLDTKVRFMLQDYLLRVHNEYNLTTILISHDIGEVIKLADQVFIIADGNISRAGNPTEIFVNDSISGKFKFTGEVLSIEKQDVVYVVAVLIQTNVVKVIASKSEVYDLKVGDSILVASKAFNPIIYKISTTL